jgi:hypothetical protein
LAAPIATTSPTLAAVSAAAPARVVSTTASRGAKDALTIG